MAFLLKYSFILIFVILYTVIAKSREKGLTLKAPLIHWSSSESPYYRPNATAAELLRASIRASHARVKRNNNKISGKNSGKWAVSPVTNTDGEFLMKFSAGTPAFDIYAVPDTGSDLVWFQCENCSSCFYQKQPLFDPSQSTTYKALQCLDADCKGALGDDFFEKCTDLSQPCKYHAEYVDESYSEGVISQDVFTFESDNSQFGNYTIKDAFFGCGLNNSQAVPTYSGFHAPGIIGLSSDTSSLVSQLTLGQQKQFSYCMSLPEQGREHGKIEIQFGPAASVSGPSTALAPNKYSLYFFRDIDGLFVNDEWVDVPDWMFQFTEEGIGGVLMDTGTTYTYFRKVILDSLVQVLKGQIQATDYMDYSNNDFPLCYLEEDWLYASLPDIELRFKNSTTVYPFTIPNSWRNNYKGQYCLAIFIEDGGRSVLGMYQQRDIKFGYDLEAYTVSFTETNNCNPY